MTLRTGWQGKFLVALEDSTVAEAAKVARVAVSTVAGEIDRSAGFRRSVETIERRNAEVELIRRDLVEAMRGSSLAAAAARLGVSKSRIYATLRSDPDLAEAVADVRTVNDADVRRRESSQPNRRIPQSPAYSAASSSNSWSGYLIAFAVVAAICIVWVVHRGSSSNSPGGDFCTTHSCIANFDNGNGSVVQCADGTWSQSGGIQGACSGHGGEG